jgi:hypothetical protein
MSSRQGLPREAGFARRNLFLLGHLRSYSSVLSHILGSHPQVNGYCETHTKYHTRFDLWRLHRRVRKLTGEALNGDYVFDKILHEWPMAGSILSSSRTRAIILIRRPRETVRSIIELGLIHSPIPWHRDFELVARYYETRLAGLLRLTEALRGRVVFLEAEALLANTQDVLEQLGVFLELQSPLQAGQGRFAPTGGMAAPAHSSPTAVSLPRPLTIRLQTAYDFWCAAIRQSCPTIRATSSTAGTDERSSR